MPHIILLGTCDTKLEELLYTREQILRHADTEVTLIDVGRDPVSDPAITISPTELRADYAPDSAPSDISSLARGELNEHMAVCATNYVRTLLSQKEPQRPVNGIMSLGGSSGTSLSATVMRSALPMGFPKLIVSTIASGETGPIIGETDITLMYSIVDIAGLNPLLRTILSNAAGAIFGMATAHHTLPSSPTPHPTTKTPIQLGITMFGVTTPAVTAIRAHLTTLSTLPTCPYTFPPPHIFHATGHGGLAYESLVASGALDAAIDLTTTELADHLVPGAVMSAGPARLSAAARRPRFPTVVSLGALDMANFGPRASVPGRYEDRKLYVHNPSVTLMRTSPEECARVGEWLARKLREEVVDKRLCQVWIPRGGVSAMSVAGGPFEDREADAALFGAVREGLRGSGVEVVEVEAGVNDEGFARGVVEALVGLLGVRDGEGKEGRG